MWYNLCPLSVGFHGVGEKQEREASPLTHAYTYTRTQKVLRRGITSAPMLPEVQGHVELFSDETWRGCVKQGVFSASLSH